jgi:hypothetical protein
MKCSDLAVGFAVLAALAGVVPCSAQAQAREALALSGAQALSVPPAPLAAQQDDTGRERDPTPMAVIGVGFKIGAAGMGEGKFDIESNGQTYPGRVDSRRGLHLALPIALGGEGFGWTLEPYLSKASVMRTFTDLSGQPSGEEEASLTAYGVYTGPAVQLQVVQPLYLGVGIGLKGAYVASDDFRYGFDAYARVPVSATYYVLDDVALMVEVGLGYGVSAYVNKPVPVVDAQGRLTNVESDAQFGKAFAWDCSIGVRLP